MHGENLELSLKDREPVNVYDHFLSQNLNQGRNKLAKWVLLKWWRPFKHLETRASPLHDVGRTLPSQRAGAKSPTRVITRFCKLIQNTIFPEDLCTHLVVNHLWQCCSNRFMIRSHPKVLKKHQVVLAWVGDESCDWRNLGNVTFSFIAIKIRLW